MSVWRRVVEERRRVVVPLVVLLLANVGVLLLAVLPIGRIVANQQTAALGAQQRLVNAKQAVEAAGAASDRTEAAESGLRTLYAEVLPQGFDDAVQVTNFWLTDVATRAGVRFERGQYDFATSEDSLLTQMTGQAILTGDYPGVRRFLYAVETADPFVIIDRIELVQPGDGTTDDRRLELVLNVSTYYVDPARAGEGGGGS